MKICVQGLWHLGSVTAACLASIGHEVVGLDSDEHSIDGLNAGKAPLFEPGLDGLLASGLEAGRLSFTNSIAVAVAGAQVLWVTFDTPVDEDDKADVDFVMARVMEVLPELDAGTLVLVSSQMPVGSIRRLEAFAQTNLAGKQLGFASSPENLRLGKALDVFLKPDRVVVGVRTSKDRGVLEELLAPITDRIEWMSVESAEMTKHAINAFLATSVTFANEIASICEVVGADAKEVERGLKSEMRIGPKAYLSPGGPFAGGTLARDIEFLGAEGRSNALLTPLLSSIRASNDEHKNWPRRQLLDQFTSLKGVAVAIWGLTYKPGTDTLRRSLAVELCDWLLEQGADVHVHDPVVRQLPQRWEGKLTSHENALEAVIDADALVIGTEWPDFQSLAVGLAAARPGMIVIDANRHLYAAVKDSGLRYIAVGTPLSKVE
ncbi:UDP-glucose dehydrogenase family protein [Pollutimonas bauzanensis]|uniref:UDP-glucose 6-dehydrogenase n=1 Tax=Pollutimonas bauzanensis TaxID=658167 RepID=A0A1M5ZTT7_9BURK|nr:nucleotide sugar dehydrogenase [Pollutimonas bauzanensis]SHI27715.1 UDPglucose 6-dehydrogenase [Pollutimonas bauzanensis]